MVIRPFTVGHVIKSKGQVYVIDEISLFSTRAHLFDGPKVTILITNFGDLKSLTQR